MTTPQPQPQTYVHGTPSPGGYGIIPPDPYAEDNRDIPSELGKLPCAKRVTDNALGKSPRHGYKGRTGEAGTHIRG